VTIDEVVAAIGLAGCRCERDPYSDDESPQYVVYAPRHLVADATRRLDEVAHEGFCVDVRQARPGLVGATPGQFVRVYSEHEVTDESSPIGVVTSAQEVDGQTAYGCSYVQVGLGNTFVSDLYSFQLTEEDYGGYHAGFLAVIDPADLPAILTRMVEDGHQAAVKRAAARRERSLRAVPAFVAALLQGTTQQAVRWSVDEQALPVGVEVRLKKVVAVPR